MTSAIIALLVAIAPALVALLLRWLKNRDDTSKILERAQQDADGIIARGPDGIDDLNRALDDGLRQRLRAVQAQGGGDPGGQNSDLAPGGSNVSGPDQLGHVPGSPGADAGNSPSPGANE